MGDVAIMLSEGRVCKRSNAIWRPDLQVLECHPKEGLSNVQLAIKEDFSSVQIQYDWGYADVQILSEGGVWKYSSVTWIPAFQAFK